MTQALLSPGIAVKTTQANPEIKNNWTAEGLAARKWGVNGKIIIQNPSRDLSYHVQHEDGSMACYYPSELEVPSN